MWSRPGNANFQVLSLLLHLVKLDSLPHLRTQKADGPFLRLLSERQTREEVVGVWDPLLVAGEELVSSDIQPWLDIVLCKEPVIRVHR